MTSSGSQPAPTPPVPNVDLRVAKIGAVAVLLGAIVGALGASVPAVIVSQGSISAEDVRVQRSFLNENRQESFANLLATHAEMRDSEVLFLGIVVDDSPGNLGDTKAAVAESEKEMRRAVAEINLIAGTDVSTRAAALSEEHNRVATYLGILEVLDGGNPPLPQPQNGPPLSVEQARALIDETTEQTYAMVRSITRDTYERLESELISAMRSDLDIDLVPR